MLTPQFQHDRMARYLQDPLSRRMFDEIRAAGPVRSVQIDITHRCNIRCQGCYFFAEGMDQYEAPKDEETFDAFIEAEKARGTNYVTVVGGEPSMMLPRLKKIYDNFWMVVVTNGIRKIPYEGFENLAIAVSVWGDHDTDKRLRGSGKIDVFARGLANYKDDRRAAWYYTTTPGNAHEIESVVTQCIENGNFVGFNFYGDIANLGGDVDHRRGFGKVCEGLDRMIERYPHRILSSSYLAHTVATGKLFENEWGFDVCCTLSGDKEKNRQRMANGKASNPHFRVYNPDLETTRVCCRSEKYDCENCYDTWAHMAWIMANVEDHLGSESDFVNWLSTMYMFYLANRIIDFEHGAEMLPAIHQRLADWRRRGAWGLAAAPANPEEIAQLVYESL
jgi:sulfatase maturation enzyme AslB (radical SAM superfamily)